MSDTVYEILRGHVGGIDGKNYFKEIPSDKFPKEHVDKMIKKGVLRIKGDKKIEDPNVTEGVSSRKRSRRKDND